MDIIIQHNKDIQNQLTELDQHINNRKLTKPIINKLKIANDKLLEVSEILTKLNINMKQKSLIQLDDKEKEYLQMEKDTNELISKIMPIMTVLALHN